MCTIVNIRLNEFYLFRVGSCVSNAYLVTGIGALLPELRIRIRDLVHF
jgi:hypothetical protein